MISPSVVYSICNRQMRGRKVRVTISVGDKGKGKGGIEEKLEEKRR